MGSLPPDSFRHDTSQRSHEIISSEYIKGAGQIKSPQRHANAIDTGTVDPEGAILLRKSWELVL